MIIVEIVAALLALVFLILLLPFSYSLSFEKWKLEIKVSLLLGLISKRKAFSLHDKEEWYRPLQSLLKYWNVFPTSAEIQHISIVQQFYWRWFLGSYTSHFQF